MHSQQPGPRTGLRPTKGRYGGDRLEVDFRANKMKEDKTMHKLAALAVTVTAAATVALTSSTPSPNASSEPSAANSSTAS
jgi:hypothetical protein